MVYILLPLYPECRADGPEGVASHMIITHQVMTISFMQERLREAGIEPSKCLHFFCLGSKEKLHRNMVYVHSKMMIVDDKFIVVGSANLNQRSLEGFRDSEICLCSMSERLVQNFRVHCWKNLIGIASADGVADGVGTFVVSVGGEDVVIDPSAPQALVELAKSNLEIYCSMEEGEMTGFLMQYPMVPGSKMTHFPHHSGRSIVIAQFSNYPKKFPVWAYEDLMYELTV
jgi:hypothetical protein